MLFLRTFGGLSVENAVFIGGAAARRRPLAILAILAIEGRRGLGRDKLCALVWPEVDQARASASLRQALSALRAEFGERDLVIGTAELRLNPDVIASDVERFEMLLDAGDSEQAIDLYAGPFLDGVFLKNAPDFERWVDGQRTRLKDRCVAAIEGKARQATDAGDHDVAVACWRRLSQLDPSNARVGVGLMTALGRAGDPAAAIQHYRVLEILLREEYGTSPTPELTALADRIRARPTVGAAVGPHTRLSPAQATAPSPSSAPPRAVDETNVFNTRDGIPKSSPRVGIAGRRRKLALLGLGTVALLVVSALAWRVRPPRFDLRRVVVTPFQNETGDSTFDLVGQIAADWVTHGLTRTGIVDAVDSRTLSTTLAADSNGSKLSHGLGALAHLARATGASAVVWGSFYRDGDSLRFQVEVANPESGVVEHVLDPIAAPVSAPTLALDALRQRVMGVFAAASDPRLAVWATRTSQPPRYDAYGAYVRGVEAHAREDWGAALGLYLDAARLDTGFVEATLSALGAAYDAGELTLSDSLFAALRPRRDRLTPFDQADFDAIDGFLHGETEKALVAARQLVNLAKGSQRAHFRLGWAALNAQRYHESVQAFRHVTDLPGWMNNWPHFYFWSTQAYHSLGDHESELREVRHGRQQFPRDSELCVLELRALIGANRIQEAVNAFPSCDALQPPGSALRFRVAQELRAHGHPREAMPYFEASQNVLRRLTPPRPAQVARDAYLMGQWKDAIASYEPRLMAMPNDAQILGMVGVAAAALGDGPKAREMADRLQALRPADSFGVPESLMWRGRIAAMLGDRDAGIELLRQCFARGISAAAFFHLDPTRILLQGYAPYDNLLKSRD